MNQPEQPLQPIPFLIQKLEDDIALRASIGSNGNMPGFYCRYRGDRAKILEMLKQMVMAFEAYQQIPELNVTPDSKFAPGSN